MAQFRWLGVRLRYSRSEQQTLLLCLLFGSLFGALCARLHDGTLPSETLGAVRQVPLIRVWLRGSLFPILMAVALLMRSKALFRLLFFFKGALFCFTLCAFAASGVSLLTDVLPSLFFETVLSLPLLLLIGSVWSGQIADRQSDLWLLVPALVFQFFAILIETILF